MTSSPIDLINESDASFLVLSVSDNHANILIRNNTKTNLESLLKLTVTPDHKDSLVVQKYLNSVEQVRSIEIDTEISRRVLGFLNELQFDMASDSGAEYSYYSAFRSSSWFNMLNPLKYLRPTKSKPAFRMELISPASDRQIQRSLPAPAFVLVEETKDMYQRIVKQHIHALVESGTLSWIQNVIHGTKESERLLLNNDEYILNIDTKWRSHPDPKTTSLSSWKDDASVRDLYCLAIVKDGTIASLRDLNASHIPLLRSMLQNGTRRIEEVYGVRPNNIRVFVHYHPQFYHFHVHFTRLENEIGCQVERGHLLSDVIQNLELDGNYYVNRTITYKLKTNSELHKLLQQ